MNGFIYLTVAGRPDVSVAVVPVLASAGVIEPLIAVQSGSPSPSELAKALLLKRLKRRMILKIFIYAPVSYFSILQQNRAVPNFLPKGL